MPVQRDRLTTTSQRPWLAQIIAGSKKIAAAAGVLGLLLPVCSADDGTGADAFCERELSEFSSLLRLSRPDRVGYWQQRLQQTVEHYNAKSAELQRNEAILKAPGGPEDVGAVFEFDYLNEIRELRLSEDTALVEDIGRELVNDRAAMRLSPMLHDIETRFRALQGKKQSETLEASYVAFLQLQREATRLEASAPVKAEYAFEPRASAYASSPIKTARFTVHDWNAVISQLDGLTLRLQPIQDTLHAASFFAPKDPVPWLPVAAQLSFLLVATAGWIKSYHGGRAYLLMAVLVVPSMLFSIFLVYYSEDTLLNILRQLVVPAIFVLYWIAKENGWLAWIRQRADRFSHRAGRPT